MADVNDGNTKIITEFRANQGRVGGPFQGAPLTLVHHRGRKSGREYVNPVMCLQSEDDWRSHHPRPRVASRLTN
jgi:hypothetical protein